MRQIIKAATAPASIREWNEAQLQLGYNMRYCDFGDASKLCADLIAEQFGLCAYTGTPIDKRLMGYNDNSLVFRPHNEHIKPQSLCRKELEDRGGVYGRELCEDMDYYNIVAALEVRKERGATSEIFGAAARENKILPVTPLQPRCEERFRFDAEGAIHGLDEAAQETISLLKLHHKTLKDWRRGAILAFFPDDLLLTREEIEQRIEQFEQPVDGRLIEFSFCISSYARSLLA